MQTLTPTGYAIASPDEKQAIDLWLSDHDMPLRRVFLVEKTLPRKVIVGWYEYDQPQAPPSKRYKLINDPFPWPEHVR